MKGITERKEKYSESLGASQRLQAQQEEAAMRRSSNPPVMYSPDRYIYENNMDSYEFYRVKQEFQKEKLQRISTHKSKELKALEERKKMETRIGQRNQEEMMRSSSALGEFLRKGSVSCIMSLKG